MRFVLVCCGEEADGFSAVNALPETSFVVVNHRIAVDSSASVRPRSSSCVEHVSKYSNSQVIKEKLTDHAVALAKVHNLDVDAFGEKFSFGEDGALSGGQLKLVGIKCVSLRSSFVPECSFLSQRARTCTRFASDDAGMASPLVVDQARVCESIRVSPRLSLRHGASPPGLARVLS